jgi:hypothetical protein
MVREPAVAGKFYPADPQALRAAVKSNLSRTRRPIAAVGCLVPHAGYVYSGKVAGTVFSAIEIPAHCIVLCPNHTGRGHSLSLMTEGKWRTPLGDVPIASELARGLMRSLPELSDDSSAHHSEHAIEVELPFLQMLRPDVQIVPIAVGTAQPLLLESLGQALAAAIRSSEDPVLIVASSDMNHYEDDDSTRIKDHKAIKKLLALDPAGLFETVRNENISMCGFGPAVAMLTAANLLGAKKAELVHYATSAEASGDKEMCVGYAGIVVG